MANLEIQTILNQNDPTLETSHIEFVKASPDSRWKNTYYNFYVL